MAEISTVSKQCVGRDVEGVRRRVGAGHLHRAAVGPDRLPSAVASSSRTRSNGTARPGDVAASGSVPSVASAAPTTADAVGSELAGGRLGRSTSRRRRTGSSTRRAAGRRARPGNAARRVRMLMAQHGSICPRPHRIASPVMECAGPATVVFDPTLTEYDFGPAHPMSPAPGRPDDAAGRRPRRDRRPTGLRLVDAPFATLDQIATVHDAQLIEAVERCGRTSRPEELLGLGHRRQPGLRGHARGRGARGRRQPRGVPPGLERRVAARREHHRRPAPRDARTGPAASASTTTSRSASSGCSTRAPSGWRTSTSTCTTATASSRSSGTTRGCSRSPCTRPGRCSSPGTGFPEDLGGAGAEGTAVNVALPPGTADAGWLRAFHAVVPDAGARVRAGGAGHPARLRLARRGPAGAPDAQRRRPAGGVPRPPRPRPRGRRRPLGRHRRAAATRWSRWCPAPGRTCWRSSAGHRWTRRPRRRSPGAPTSGERTGGDGRPRRSPTAGRRATGTGADGYDPDTWLDRACTRRGRRSSRCTASIPVP